MRIAIIAPGSRGDLEPYLALGKGLKKAGHAVRLVSHKNFDALVNAQGLEFWPVDSNAQDIAQSQDMSERLQKGNFPFFGDQPFWERRVAELGVGPEPIAFKKLTVEALAQAIRRAVTDHSMRQRAADLGAKIRAEDGIAAAVAVVHKLEESLS